MEDQTSQVDEGVENYNFVQINKGYMQQLGALIKKNSLSAQILMFLVDKMGKHTNAVVCSYKTLQEATGYKRSSVAQAIKTLKEDRWVEAVKVGSATAYCVNAKVFWQAARNQKKYAMFQATVVASESEQDSDFHNLSKKDIKNIPFIDKDDRAIISNDPLPPPDQQEMLLN